MLFWGSLEPVRRALLKDGSQASPAQVLAANCCAGGLGGAAAAAITTPLVGSCPAACVQCTICACSDCPPVLQDVVKTRVQLAAGTQQSSQQVWPALRALHAEGGLSSLFTGVGPRMMRAGPSCAIVLASYELLKTVQL